jgi:3-oxoadipate CoA-transferase, beta subunit
MDLAVGAKEIRILVEHTTRTGAPRIRRRCGLPLTAARVVRRIYTDLAVIDVTPDGLLVREIVDGVDFPALQAKTEARLHPDPNLHPLQAPPV